MCEDAEIAYHELRNHMEIVLFFFVCFFLLMTENCLLMNRLDDWKMLRNNIIYQKVAQIDVCCLMISLCIMLYLPLGLCTSSPV